MNQHPDLFSFHNTIAATGKDLVKFEKESFTQEEKVLAYFKRVGRSTALKASQVLGMHEISARARITTLTKKGFLRKTDEQVMEKYGKKNYIYSLPNN